MKRFPFEVRKPIPCAVLAIVVLLLLPGIGHTDVLTFGPLTSTTEITMPANYGGFIWLQPQCGGLCPGWLVLPNSLYDAAYGDTYGAPSGAAAVPPEANGPLYSSTPFTFLGADFSSYAANDSFTWLFSATAITVYGYNAQNQLVGTASMSLSPTGYNFLSADIPDVTELIFEGTGYGSAMWLMDDFTYTLGPPTTTPEPSGIVLLLVGLAGIICVTYPTLKQAASK